MLDLPTDLPRRYRCQLRVWRRAGGAWECSYEPIGARGGVHLHVAGPHHYDGGEHWSAGLEFHGRAPLDCQAEQPPSHDVCWLLNCPCWHDGTSLYAEEEYLPLVLAGSHATVFRSLIHDADKRWPALICEPPC